MPILLLPRVEGKLFSPMALTLAFAVVGSLLCALTLIPVLISFAYRKSLSSAEAIRERKNLALDLLTNGYKHAITGILNFPRTAVIAGSAIVLTLILFGGKHGSEFLPELDEGSIFMRAFLPSGVNIQEN